MNFLKLFILNFCPINIFRPILFQRLPHIYRPSLVEVFENVLERDETKYNMDFREIYDISLDDDVFIFSYYIFEEYYKENLKNKDLPYSKLFKINKLGCVYRTKVPVYRGLQEFVGKGVLEHHYLYHTLIIILVTNFSCLMSSLQVFKNKYLQFIFTSLIIIVPHLLVMYLMDGLYLALTMIFLFSLFIIRYLMKSPWKNKLENQLKNGFVHYVNFAKGSLISAIVIAILAVDNIYFNQFMRKTHYDGFSAMDIGAGFFISQTGSSIALSKRKKNLWIILKKNIIILVIAVIRTVSVIIMKYGVDEREYGRHWNFFYTLGFTRMAVDAINTYCHEYVKWFLVLTIPVLYETILLTTKAIEKLPFLDRSNFIYANREGLMGLPNSITTALFILLLTKIAIKYYKEGKVFHTFLTYMFTSLLFFFLANLLYFFKLKSSRAMNNMRYLMYVMFLYNLALGSVVIFEIIYPNYKDNIIIDAVGRYPLMVYLIANILTGIVNVSFKPYLLPLPLFIIIMVVYTYIPLSFAILFKKLNIKAMSQWI